MSTVITEQETKEHLAANLTRILRERGMSVRALARETGENAMQISRITRGSNVPNLTSVARIAEALDVSIDALLRPVAKN